MSEAHSLLDVRRVGGRIGAEVKGVRLSGDLHPATVKAIHNALRTVYETEQPLVALHPHTGKKVLILGNFIQRLLGYRTSDSRALLEIFHRHATSPENTIRWAWSLGDVAVWDNRATLHRAVDDFGDEPRTVRRSTVVGEPAVGVDGRRATTRVIGGKPAAAVA